MKLIPLKCPNCAAALELDSERDFAFCQYCGSKILIKEEAINQKVTIDRSADLMNLLKLGKLALTDKDFTKALDYAEKALIIDAECRDAANIRYISTIKLNGNASDDFRNSCTHEYGVVGDDIEKYYFRDVTIIHNIVRKSLFGKGVNYPPIKCTFVPVSGPEKQTFVCVITYGEPLNIQVKPQKYYLFMEQITTMRREVDITDDCNIEITMQVANFPNVTITKK